MKLNKLVLIVVVAALAGSAMAQGGGGQRRGGQRGGGNQYSAMNLVRNEDVQKEIGITDDQKAKITDLQTSTRQKSQEARQNAGDDQAAAREATTKINEDAQKQLAAILTPDQVKRLKELQIQWGGLQLVSSDKQLQSDLGVTDDQKAKFADLRTKQQQAMTDARANANGDRQAMMEAMQKLQKDNDAAINQILTDDQKAKLATMGGKPMAKPASLTQGRRGGGGGRGGGV